MASASFAAFSPWQMCLMMDLQRVLNVQLQKLQYSQTIVLGWEERETEISGSLWSTGFRNLHCLNTIQGWNLEA